MVLRAAAAALAALLLAGGAEAAPRKVAVLCPEAVYPEAEDPPAFPGEGWIKARDPGRWGWDASRLAAAFEMADRLGLAAVMVIEDGRLVAHWGCTRTRWYVASVRKSFMGAVLGAYVADGRLRLETTLEALGVDEDAPPLSPAERATPVARLMTSSSGICRPAAAGSVCRPEQAAERPGGFLYNNWDFNALHSVHAAVAGVDFFEDFERRIAGPIGMEGFEAARDGALERVPESRHPAYVMQMSAEDMARFGLLALNGGRWDGRQVLPEGWMEESARPRLETDARLGAGAYGLLWWVQVADGEARYGVPEGSFSAEGNWAQAIVAIPARRTVVVTRGYIPEMAVFGKPGPEETAAFFRALLAADRDP